MKRVELLVHEYTKTVSIFHFFHSNKHHMSKKEMIHPTHFLVPTVLSTPRTKTKGLNFFGSIKIGMGANLSLLPLLLSMCGFYRLFKWFIHWNLTLGEDIADVALM